jgi:hypothetical protein
MPVDSSGSIPVQAVLKLIVDRVGSDAVEEALKKQDAAFAKIEQTTSRIGTSMEGVAKTVGDLVGIAGIGALVDKFIRIESASSNIALAMGKVTGGSGVYGGIRQELLGVQSRTGVGFAEQESALRSLASSIGLSPKPGQAGMLAEVIAGYSRVTGVPTSALGSILGPMLQAEGRPTSPGAAAYTLGEARANLSAFPGSQIEGMLPVVSGLATTAALGTAKGAGKGVEVGGIAALLNTISGPGSVLRQPGIAQQAAEGIGGTLQGAYQNPRVYAFMKMAGIGFKEMQLGFNTPQVQEKLVREARRQYPGETEADWTKRRLLYLELGQGEPGADALERIESATLGGGIHVVAPNAKKEASERYGAQTLTTPEATLSKAQGGVLGWLFESPLHAGLALAGGFALKNAIEASGSALRGIGAAGLGALGVGLAGGAAAGGALGLAAGDIGKELHVPFLERMGTSTEYLFSHPESALKQAWGDIFGSGGSPGAKPRGLTPQQLQAMGRVEQEGIMKTFGEAEGKFGSGWLGAHWQTNPAERKKAEEASAWINKHLTPGERSKASEEMGKMREYEQLGPQGYAAKQQSESSQKFKEAVEVFAKSVTGGSLHGTAYTGGATMHNAAYMGAPMVAAMQSTVPGMVMAALLKRPGSPGTTPMPTAMPTALDTTSSGSMWNAVLEKYSGGSYGLSHVEQLAGEHPGGGAHPGDLAMVKADAKKYGIPWGVLWGIYGAESSFGKAASSFGLTSQFPGTGTSGNFGTDARMSAEDLRALMKQVGLTVNVEVNGSKVQKHQTKIGGAQLV